MLAAAAILALPRDAHAVEVGDFKVILTETGGEPTADEDYEYADKVLVVKTFTPLTISMRDGVTETTTDTIVTAAEGANVTLAGVAINVAGTSAAAMDVASGSLNLTLAEGTTNSLKSGDTRAGLENGTRPLFISGSGSLEARGAEGGAGIGGEINYIGANITISGSVTVVASGAEGGAGIGGGYNGNGQNINIAGGYVEATAGEGADAIGGGQGKPGTSGVAITGGAFPGAAVSGGKVYGVALAPNYIVTDNTDGFKDRYQKRVVREIGDFYVWSGVCDMDYAYAGNVLTVKTSTPLTISMKDGMSETTTDAIATKAEGANVTLAGVAINKSGTVNAAAMDVASGSLNLTLAEGTTNSLKSGNDCAGLENGSRPLFISGSGSLEAIGGGGTGIGAGIGGRIGFPGSNITISGSATVEAVGGISGGAGIGSGGLSAGIGITISGSATVKAVGGYGSAGIGGGYMSSGASITISGGYVEATAGEGADAIGGGSGATSDAGVSITGGAFPEDAVADGKVYGVGLTSGYALGANEDGHKDSFPHRVYSTGDFNVQGGAYGADFEYAPGSADAPGVLTINTSTSLTISMKDGVTDPTKDTIVTVADGANVTLAGVNIDVSGKPGAAAMSVASGSLNLTLASDTENSLKSGENRAGLENGTNTLVIAGSGTLEAMGGIEGAGIGGGGMGAGSHITITGSGTVQATGGSDSSQGGAGIGGGGMGAGSHITITGDVKVMAEGGSSFLRASGAGIGGGGNCFASSSNITISGSATVEAEGGAQAAGIGGGGNGEGAGTGISISGGYVKATAGDSASPIGNGSGATSDAGVTITGGAFADAGARAGDTEVYGVELPSGYVLSANADALKDDFPVRAHPKTGDFNVEGGEYGKDYEYSFTDGPLQTLGKLTVKDGAELTISMRDGADDPTGDVIEAIEGKAHITLAGVNIDASGQDGVAAFSVTAESLDLELASGSTNSLKSAANRAGLQKSGDNSLSISGSGSLEACGSGGGAGIGGGQGGHASNITISGSVQVIAVGGTQAAGIGGGHQGSGTNISISGGYVKATAGNDAADPIGGGPGAQGTSGVAITGGAFADDAWSEGMVYGVTLSEDYLAAHNNDTDENLRTSYPVRVYAIQDSILAFKDEPQDFEYDGSPINPIALIETAKRGDTDASADVTWSYSIVDSTDKTDIAPTNAGTYNVVATLPAAIVGGVSYKEATAEAQMTISPKPLTATVNSTDDSAERTYDGAVSFAGVKLDLEGIITGDGVTATADGIAASKDAGDQAFTATTVELSGADKDNYFLAPDRVSGSVTVSKRGITATSAQVANKTYDKTTGATLVGIEFDGLADGESLVPGDDFTASASFESADVGEGKKVNVTNIALVADGPVAKNYALVGDAKLETTASITQGKAGIEFSVVRDNPTYGDRITFNAEFDFSTTTFSARQTTSPTFQFCVVDADGVERVLTEVTGLRETSTVAMNYSTQEKGLAIGPNTVYARSSGFGNLVDAISDPVTVTLAPRTVEPTVAVTGTTTKPYDGTTDLPEDAVSTVGLNGLVGGDNVSATASFAFASADAHTTQVNATDITLSGSDAGFYALSAETASVDAPGGITRADALNLSASATMPNYPSDYEARIDLEELLPNGAADAAFSVAPDASYNGLVSAHVEGNELVLVADDAGNTISDEVAVAVTGMNNYEDSTITVAVSYTAKPMAYFAIQSVDGTYTGAPQAGFDAPAGATYIAPDGTEQVYTGPFEASYKVASPGPSPSTPEPPTAAGGYEVAVTIPEDAPCSGNTSVSFTIAKARLTVTPLDATVGYSFGFGPPTIPVTYWGLVDQEDESVLEGDLALSCAYVAGDPVGSYAITASGLSADNYAITYGVGTLTVIPKALTATVDTADSSASKSHDDTPDFQDVKLVLAGALDGDDVSGVADGDAADAAAGEGKPFAASTVRLGGADARNYVLDPADVTGTVTIVAAPAPEPEPDPDPEPLPAPNEGSGSGSGSGEKPTPLPGAATALAPTGDATATLAFAALALAALSTAVLFAARLRRRTD